MRDSSNLGSKMPHERHGMKGAAIGENCEKATK
jgi:hypothetical protein